MSNKVQVGMRLDQELVRRVDAVRGDVPRTKWIARSIEHGLRAWEAPTRSADPFGSFSVTHTTGKGDRLTTAARVPGVQFAPRLTSDEAKADWKDRSK